MNAKKIIFPTDFSKSSDAGLEYATILARDTGARLLIVHVEEPPAAYGGGEMYYGVLEPDHSELWRMLREVKPTDSAVAYQHRMLLGDPAEQMVQLAEDEQAHLIVLGTHGRTGFKRLFMGSVAEAVVRQATCPLISVKQARRPDNVPA